MFKKREELETALSAKEGELTAAQAELATAKTNLEDVTGKLTAAEAEVASLKAAAAAKEDEHKSALEAKDAEVTEKAAVEAVKIVAAATGEPIPTGEPKTATGNEDEKVLKDYEAMDPGPERTAFADKHEAQIRRAKEARTK